MPSSGSGTGTPISTAPAPPGTLNIFPDVCSSSVSLVRYSKIIGYSECAFFGFSREDNAKYACREIWTKEQRDMIQDYLCEAEEEIENVVGYPLTPKWITDERHSCRRPVLSEKSYVIEAGVRSEEIIQDDSVVDLITDPATITIVSAETELDKLKVYYPDTDLEIVPQSIIRSGAFIVIYIPKCRMPEYSKLENPSYGWDYADNTNFQASVDVHKISTDPSIQGKFVWSHGCSNTCLSTGCADYSKTACIIVEKGDIGRLDLRPATWNESESIWKPSTLSSVCCGGSPDYLEINYLAGLLKLSKTAETAIVRLAHSKAPTEPCGCGITQRLWKRDRNVPQILTRERLECPFGLSDGAWMAWKFASSLSMERMSIL